MRYVTVFENEIQLFFKLDSRTTPIFEERLNSHNTLVIDKSFTRDITLSFPKYIFEVYKIMNSYSRSKRTRVFDYTTNSIYLKPINETIVEDVVILTRKDNYKTMNIPYIESNGKIRVVSAASSKEMLSSIVLTSNLENYVKLRTIIFNTTVLPYLKHILF